MVIFMAISLLLVWLQLSSPGPVHCRDDASATDHHWIEPVPPAMSPDKALLRSKTDSVSLRVMALNSRNRRACARRSSEVGRESADCFADFRITSRSFRIPSA